jgi:hypothetical protein
MSHREHVTAPVDEHEAVIAVMQAQADSGRLDAAIDSADDALTLSRAYTASVRRMIAEAERDVTRVDYMNVLRPELTSAAAHLERRIRVDGTLLRHLENLRADASEEQDPAAVRQLTRAASRLGDAVDTLAGLQADVISATPRWRDAQAAQAFTAAPAAEIDPTADVLSALLAGRNLPGGHDLSPAAPRVVLNFTALANRLAAPSRQVPDPGGSEVDTEPLEDTDGVYEQFPAQFHDVAEALRARRIQPGGKARLADLLADADELFTHQVPVVATLTALAAMLWQPDGTPGDHNPWWAADDGSRAALPDLDIPDLLIYRKSTEDDRP